MKPMTAFRLNDNEKYLANKWPLYAQPKLNGVRALSSLGCFQTRYEEPWRQNVLAHLGEKLSRIPADVILDGELYVHGWSLQRINSAVAVKRLEPSANTAMVEYHVYDCILLQDLEATFAARHSRLVGLVESGLGEGFKLVRTIAVHDRKELDSFHRVNLAFGYEGTMVRTRERYGLEHNCGNKDNRWKSLLKYKDWLDGEYEVLGWNEGEGKYAGMIGSLKFEHEGMPFSAGSGLTDLQRDPSKIPSRARINYEMLSDEGVPLKPTIEMVTYAD